jgi:cold shock protein
MISAILGGEAELAKGTVKFFNTNKGYGFIAPEGGGGDVFVHVTALERAGLEPLKEGQRVEFETEVDKRSGKTAVSRIKLA